MSYINHQRQADPSRRNGIIGQTHCYLDTLGQWSTYREVSHIEHLPERIAEVTAAYFGLKGLAAGHLRLSGILGIMILLHALEQVTGGVVTTGVRLYARGKPVANYRGITIRQSPFTPQATQLLDQISSGRFSLSDGYYFFETGRTWHCQSLNFRVGSEIRTLTRLQSLSLPQREFFFDRPIIIPGGHEPEEGERSISIQRIIDLVKGNDSAEIIPGFIGSINELESLTLLRPLKLLLFSANWWLIDPDERDQNARAVDYDLVSKGSPPSGSGSSSRYPVAPPLSGPTTTRWWPSTSRPPTAPPSPPPPDEAELFSPEPPSSVSPANGQPWPMPPSVRYKDRIRIDNRDYPLVIKRVLTSPFNGGQRKVDAIYFDDRLGCWCDLKDEETRLSLARAVEAGLVSVVAPASWPVR